MGNTKVSKKKVPAPRGRRSAAPTKKPLRLEEGKRYIDRMGRKTGALREDHSEAMYPFYDNTTWRTYTSYGTVWKSRESEFDLIREVKAPKKARK